MLAQDRLDLLEIALRRNDRPTGAHDGLGEKGGDGIGSFHLDEGLERLGVVVHQGVVDQVPVLAFGRRLEEAYNKLRSEIGRNPNEPELAAELGMGLRDLQILLGEIDGLEVGSLRILSPRDGKEEDLCEYLPNEADETPLILCLRSEMKQILANAIEQLPQKEQQVLVLYYYQELTMKQVGAVLGVGESRVSQIHSVAVVRLRAHLGEMTGDATHLHPAHANAAWA